MASLTASKVAVTLITLLTGMLLSRFRTLEEYGTYSQLKLVINLVTSLVMLGLPNSLNYFLAKADSDKERASFLSVYYSLSTILSLAVGAVLIAAMPLLVAYFDNPLITGFWYFLALFPWARIIGASVENVLVVYKRSGGIVLFRILNSVLLLASVVVIQLLKLDFTAYMILYLVVEAAFAIAIYIIASRLAGGIKFSLDLRLIKEIFVFSIPIGLASMVGTLNIELDKLMIGNFLDTEQLAIYTNASHEMPVSVIAASVTAVLLPQMVKILKNNDTERAISLWSAANKISFTVICFCSVVLFAFAPEVITVLYSAKYLPGTGVFRVYSLVLLFRFTYFGMVLNSTGKTKFIFYSSVASLMINVVLNYVLFHAFGMVGPAIATFISVGVISIVQLIYTARLLGVSFAKIFPWGYMLRTTLLHGGIGVLMYAIKELSPLDSFICRRVSVPLETAKAAEAIVMGILWVIIFLVIEFKPIKQHWKSLNAAEVE